MRQTIQSFLLNAIISAAIGLIVGLVLLYNYQLENPLNMLTTSTLTGVLIGTTAKLSGGIMYRLGVRKLAWGYCFTFAITLFGCLLVSFNDPLAVKLTILGVAEPLALLATFLNIRYTLQLNDGLKRKQAILKQRKD